MSIKKTVILIICLLSITLATNAMLVKSLEINYTKLTGLTYQLAVTAFVFEHSPIDSAIEISYGDGDTGFIFIDEIITSNNGIKKCTYTGNHTYPGPDDYRVVVNYYYRVNGLKNIFYSNTEPIHIYADIRINPFITNNTSPVFTNTPILSACTGKTYTYNCGIYDADGDSIVYELIPCMNATGGMITNYFFPETSNVFEISNTGTINWDTPTQENEYAFTIKIDEYRNGARIGTIMKDISVYALNCEQASPELILPNDTCLAANDTLLTKILAYTDTDSIFLIAEGIGLTLQPSPAQFTQPLSSLDTINENFEWCTTCEYVNPLPYIFTFNAYTNDTAASEFSGVIADFNNGSLNQGWETNMIPLFYAPCFSSVDNSDYIWMGNSAPAPRSITSSGYNLSQASHIQVCWDMRFPVHTAEPGSSCEGPELFTEGVYFKYSINGGNSWTALEYWNPGLYEPHGADPMLTTWNTYCVSLPPSALTPNTKFNWFQENSDGNDYDHWGIDNVRLYKIPEINEVSKPYQVTIVPPAPENLQAVPYSNDAIFLSWEKSICQQAIGYKIYRKNEFYGFIPDNCELGVPQYTGYELIYTANSINDTTYIDNNNQQGLTHGLEYCYMVTAVFEEDFEGYASNETCTILPVNVPIITNISIEKTDVTNGKAYIAWSKPTEIDTFLNPPPYFYDVYKWDNNQYELKTTLFSLNDTIYTDSVINTVDTNLYYKIVLSNNINSLEEPSDSASSVFLKIIPGDQYLELSWHFITPWLNRNYVIYRFNENTQIFDSIAYTDTTYYLDQNLINGKTYCYKIKSIGEYPVLNTINPIENYSQERCAKPEDKTPPCVPQLSINIDCDLIKNTLIWNNPNNNCEEDAIGYSVYYYPTEDADSVLIYTTTDLSDTVYIHQNLETIAGCYSVTAFDSSGNETGLYQNRTCIDIDSCNLYELPNTFSPDGDGQNDLFIPYPYNFVDKIDLKIYNRWGNLVFETTNPDILWDGINQQTKKACISGVYFYTCKVYELRLQGVLPRDLHGSIHLFK